MSLHLKFLKLHIVTPKGLYGVEIPFKDGLTVLRADNSTGKSTCVQAIIYALGLERMLSPKLEVPLPHVMTKCIEDKGVEIPVLESDVFLEICNERGEVMTIQRTACGERDKRLISTWNGPALSNPIEHYQQKDFFVNDPGAATRPDGFHYHLASFIGWKLPLVTKFDGTECLLYMECIFPLMIVEQKHGWAGIQSNLPTFFGIKDVAKRSIEFLAGLEAYELAIKRQQVQQDENNLRQKWKLLFVECEAGTHTINGTIHGLPVAPISDWPPTIASHIKVYRNESWISVEQAIRDDKDLLTRLESEKIPNAQQANHNASQTLLESKNLLAEKEFILTALFDEVDAEKHQLEAIDFRLKALDEDQRRNKDINKLKKLGSMAELNITSDKCPTCHQVVIDSLLPLEVSENPMSIEENIKFIQSQITTFDRMRLNTVHVKEAKEKQLNSIRDEVDGIRSQIRALKQTLISDGRIPSIAALRERIILEERTRISEKIQEEFELCLDRFSDLSSEWKSIQERRIQLPKGDLSKSDKEKLDILRKLFIEQVKLYDLSSINPDSLQISEDSYKPILEGFNLIFDLSASDNIRTIWAYLTALLELSREVQTNHLGLLIFDEPRQQETAKISFAKFLKRASSAIQYQQQIIFLTSETDANLSHILSEIHNYQNFTGKIIKRIK